MYKRQVAPSPCATRPTSPPWACLLYTSLQRIYGTAWHNKTELDEYLQRLEEARLRDHRRLGKQLGLFHISPLVGSGLPLWLPKGAVLRETLEGFLRAAQRERGYLPVITPHIGNLDLYRKSGHYPYYKDSQYTPIKVDEEEFLLKPMKDVYKRQPRFGAAADDV